MSSDGPILSHTFAGWAYPVRSGGRVETYPERIAGAFAVVEQTADYATIDNGELGEAHGRWRVPASNFPALVRMGLL